MLMVNVPEIGEPLVVKSSAIIQCFQPAYTLPIGQVVGQRPREKLTIGVWVTVGVAVLVAVWLAVGVCDGVAVFDGVTVAVAVDVFVGVGVGV